MVVVVGAVDMVEAEAAEDMGVVVVVGDMEAVVVEAMVEVEEISLLRVEEAMVVGALYPLMAVEVVEEEIPLPHMVEVEAHKPPTEKVVA